MAGGNSAPFVLDGEMLRLVNEEQGYRYRQQQRYLQEDDRVEIIRRIDAGERQSELAREFKVTRAAICNTYKNRMEILARSWHVYDAQCAAVEDTASKTARGDATGNVKVPGMAKKKRRHSKVHAAESMQRSKLDDELSSGLQSQLAFSSGIGEGLARRPSPAASPVRRIKQEPGLHTAFSRDRPPPQETSRIQQLLSAPAVRLVNELRASNTSAAGFRRHAGQLMRLLIERSLEIAINSITPKVTLPSTDAVAIGVGAGGLPCLRNYQEMYPDKPVGIIRFLDTHSHTQSIDLSLPSGVHAASSIMLMTCECATGVFVCRAIQGLIGLGIAESAIVLLVAFASEQGLDRVEREYPAVRVLVAAVDHQVDGQGRIQPGCGGFLDRYYDVDVLESSESVHVLHSRTPGSSPSTGSNSSLPL